MLPVRPYISYAYDASCILDHHACIVTYLVTRKLLHAADGRSRLTRPAMSTLRL